MLPKIKHNKKRNTAFLYEALVRELTKSVVANDSDKKARILAIMKEHFAVGTLLRQELQLYRDLYESEALHPITCEKLVHEVKTIHAGLDKKQIFNEQTALINEINKSLSKEIFSNFVPNYKNLATISQILNPNTSAKNKVLLEGNLIRSLTSKSEEAQTTLQPIDNIVYSTFVKKFNEQYGDSLLEEHKQLLSQYIASFNDDSLNLKIYLNEEIGRLKHSLVGSKEAEDSTDALRENISRVLAVLDGFSSSELNEESIQQILKIQTLAKELEK